MVKQPKRVAIYARVSTDDQTVENQRRELEAAAERHGWQLVQVFTDKGVSGSKGRDKRPGFDALCAGIARRDFDMVAAWSVDRLGRSLQDLVTFLGELHGKHIDLEAAILSRMRSPVTSRSNWAKDSSTFRMRRPIEVVVLNCWVTETNETPCASNSSISLAKSASERVRRSTL
jgi:hypothetical protein